MSDGKGVTSDKGSHVIAEIATCAGVTTIAAFADGAMFKHGNMGQGIYVDPARDFWGMYFGLASNDEQVAGIDDAPGYRACYFTGARV